MQSHTTEDTHTLALDLHDAAPVDSAESLTSAPVEQEVVIQTPAPVEMSETQRLELVEQDARLMKEDIRSRLRESLVTGKQIDNERIRIESAIAQAEQRLLYASNNGGVMNTARADLLARKMMGEEVPVEELAAADAADPMDTLTVADLHTGLKALKGQLEDVKRRWNGVQHTAKVCEKDFARANAIEWGAKYMAARQQMVECWIQLRASESLYNVGAAFANTVFTSLDWDDFNLPSCDGGELMDPVKPKNNRLGLRGISAQSLRSTAVVQTRMSEIRADLTNWSN